MILRRKLPGLKHNTEALDYTVEYSGRRASYTVRSRIERKSGPYTRENVGMSSERKVRILPAENPRFPEEGSSAQGKSGPKPRPKGVGDGQRVINPVPP